MCVYIYLVFVYMYIHCCLDIQCIYILILHSYKSRFRSAGAPAASYAEKRRGETHRKRPVLIQNRVQKSKIHARCVAYVRS